MDASGPPRTWLAPILILLFVWKVGRKSGELSPKHCEFGKLERRLELTLRSIAARPIYGE
jgi:hypothetical protein